MESSAKSKDKKSTKAKNKLTTPNSETAFNTRVISEIKTSYDDMPYPDRCHIQTIPAVSHAIGTFFGLTPPPIETARVLEIGCGTGLNIITLAGRYPDASFVGMDLSSVQISQGEHWISDLNLTNVRLIAGSILDYAPDPGSFDYIIAHGVYSWVPSDVQTAILSVCQKALSKTGIAYISYNTLPGWNGVKTTRDLMQFHTAHIQDPAQKIKEARKVLKFMSDNACGASKDFYKPALESEVNFLRNADDQYLLHDHLSEVNDPCYFHEFAARAGHHQLQYLCDSYLPTAFSSNYGSSERVAKALSGITGLVQMEQYMDYLSNRRFRNSLLVHRGTNIQRKLVQTSLSPHLRFVLNYTLKNDLPDYQTGQVRFLDLVRRKGQSTRRIEGQVICTAFCIMVQALPNRLSFREIMDTTVSILQDQSPDKIESTLQTLFLQFIIGGIVDITSDQTCVSAPRTFAPQDRPRACPIAHYFTSRIDCVPDQFHKMHLLPLDRQMILKYLTGDQTVSDVCAHMKRHIKDEDIKIQIDGTFLDSDDPDVDEKILGYVQGILLFFGNSALLQADLS